jgi:hypothetical protein
LCSRRRTQKDELTKLKELKSKLEAEAANMKAAALPVPPSPAATQPKTPTSLDNTATPNERFQAAKQRDILVKLNEQDGKFDGLFELVRFAAADAAHVCFVLAAAHT